MLGWLQNLGFAASGADAVAAVLLNVEASITHPLAISASLTHPLSVAGSITFPLAIAATVRPVES